MRHLIALATLAFGSASAATPDDYAVVIPIETGSESAAYLVDMNLDVYRWSRDARLRDIAIFNASGDPVPLASWDEVADLQSTQRSALLPLLDVPRSMLPEAVGNVRIVSGSAGGRTLEYEVTETSSARPGTAREWLLDLRGLDFNADTITLDWSSPRSGVMARFDVAGSRDLQNWLVERKNAAVVLLDQDGSRIDKRSINLDRKFPYLRLTRTDKGPELENLSVEASTRKWRYGPVQTPVWIEAERSDSMSGINATETRHLYTLPATLPVGSVRAGLASDNSVAALNVLTPITDRNGNLAWQSRARFVAYRLRQDGQLISNAEVNLSAGPSVRELRVDSAAPLTQAPELKLGYLPERLVFLAEGAGPYLLAVGKAGARYPDYPVKAAINNLRSPGQSNWQPPLARLGTTRTSAGDAALVPVADAIDWKRWLLWAVLLLAAIVVGGLSLSLLRGQRSAEDGQQPPEE